MKFAVKLVLLIFIVFLATPTVVSVINKTCDTSKFYSMSEEELAHKEVKASLRFDTAFIFPDFYSKTSRPILSKNDLKHDNIAAAIFIPPPDQI